MASRSKKLALFTLSLTLLWLSGWAQTFPLQIQVSVMPPYSAYLQDYPGTGQQVRVFVINTSRNTYQIRLTGQLTGDNGIEIRTSPNYRPPRPVTVPPGQTLLTRNDLEGLFDLNQIEVTGIDKNLLSRGFPLPDGTYQLCVRAYNETATNTATTAFGLALSSEFPLGCSAPIIVKSVEPPILISPLCDAEVTATIPQALVFTWTPPAGVSPASVDYTLRVVELPQENVDPNVFIDAIVLPKSGVEVRNLRTSTFLYGPTQPPLVVGKRYAWRVQAIDRSGKLHFQNDGKSPVCAFTYGNESTPFKTPGIQLVQTPSLPIIPIAKADSSAPPSNATKVFKSKVFCKAVDLPTATNPQAGPLNGKTVKLGEFDLTIATATFTNGGYNGEGRVTWNSAPIKVSFTGLKVNGQNQVFDGDVNSDSKGPGTPNIPLGQIDGYGGLPNNYFDQVKTSLLDAAKQAVAIPLPLKYDGKIGTVGINQMSFSPVGAKMDMVVGVSLPEANLNLFLAAVDVCTRPQQKLPNTGTLYLIKDLPMPIPGGIGQKFVFKKSDPNSAKPDGTYAAITNGDFDKVHGVLDLNLGGSILKPDDGKGSVKTGDLIGTITADFVQWSDWVGTVSLPPFQVPGLSGVTFTGNDVVYDHSDKANPDGFSLPKEYNGDTGPTFHGTYFKKVTVELPKSFKDSPRIGVSVNGGIIDGSGFTGLIASANTPILDYTKGSLAGFGFGIDDIQWTIVQNSNRGGNILGKLQFPISTDFFSYSCSLSGGFDNVQFTASPKDGYNVPLFAATMDLNANTAITVTYKSGQKTQINMSLGGKVAIDVKKYAGSGAVGKAIDTVLPKLYFEKFTIGNTSTPGATALGSSGLFLNTGNWNLANDVAKNDKPSGNSKKGGGPWSPDDELYEWATAPSDDAKPSLAGFPLDFDPPTIVSTKEGTGVQLGIGMHLGEGADDAQFVQAKGKLDVLGTVTSDGNRFKPVFNGVYPRSIKINGGIGPLTVNGGVDFINSDLVYGNGIKGNADVTIPGFGATIKMMMLFGNVSGFKYGFVDGSVQFSTGVPIAGPVVMTGLGGGMHYNMSMTVNGQNALTDPNQVTKLAKATELNSKALPPVDLTQPGKTMSGAVFKPSKGGWGLTAKIYAGLVDPHVFNASLAMTVDFAGGSMGGVNMHGNANIISESGDGDGADGVAHAAMDITYTGGVMDASLQVDASFLTTKVKIPFGMHVANNNDWYVKLGDPQNENNRITVTLFDIGNDKSAVRAYLAAKGYLAVGVGPNLGGLPDVPSKVDEFLKNAKGSTLSEATAAYKQRSLPDLSATGENYKLLLGGSMEGNLKVQVQPFRLWANAIVGFDAALAKNLKCGESGSIATGIKGWYGTGQAYAYVGGGIDIYVDVWFFSGSLSLMTLEAGAVLKVGLPDPVWADGKVKVKGEVLDGLISVETTQNFSFGTKCTPVYNGDPLKDIDIIAEFTPQEGETGISCRPTMAVAFNMPMHQPFEVHIPNAIRTYKFIPDAPVFTFKDGKQPYKPFADLNAIKWSADGKSYILSASAFLPSYAACKLVQNVVIKEIGAGGQLDDPYIDAKGIREARHQEKSTSFTLGKQPDEIPLDAIQRMWPVITQNYFLKKELPQGFIRGQYKGLTILDDVDNPAYQYTAEFKKAWDGSTVTSVPIQYDKNGRITFAIPNALQNQERYIVDIIKRKKPTGSGAASSLTSAKYVSMAQGKVNFLKTSLNIASVQASATASESNKGNILFSVTFGTSKYNTFLEKMKGLQLKATDYLVNYKLEFRSTPGPGYEPFDSFDKTGYVVPVLGSEILTPMLTVSAHNVQTPNNPFENTMKTRVYDVMQELHDNGSYDTELLLTYLGKEMNEDGYEDQGNYKYEGQKAVPIDPTLNQNFVAYEDWREKIPVTQYHDQGWFPDLQARPLDKAAYWSYNGSDMVSFTYMRDHIMLSDMGALVQFFNQMRTGNTAALRAEYQLASGNPDWYKLPKGMTEQQFVTKYLHDGSQKLSYGFAYYGSSPTMSLHGLASHSTYVNYWKTIEDVFYKSSNYDYGDVPKRTEKSPMNIAFRYDIPDKNDIATRVYTNNFIIGEINKFVPLQVFFPTTFYYFPMGGN